MTIGDRINYLRTRQNLTLAELGAKIGVSASTIHKWETGYIKSLGSDKLPKLAAALDTSVDYLMGSTDNSVSIGSVGTNNGVIGPNSGDIMIAGKQTKEEAELIRIYNALDVRSRSELLAFAWSLEEKHR